MDSVTKHRIHKRLEDEGLWNEAHAYKEEQRLRLRGEGVRKPDSVVEAWKLMMERYPPVPEWRHVYQAAVRLSTCVCQWLNCGGTSQELRQLLWVKTDCPAVRRVIRRAVEDPAAFVRDEMPPAIEAKLAELREQEQTEAVRSEIEHHEQLLSPAALEGAVRAAADFKRRSGMNPSRIRSRSSCSISAGMP